MNTTEKKHDVPYYVGTIQGRCGYTSDYIKRVLQRIMNEDYHDQTKIDMLSNMLQDCIKGFDTIYSESTEFFEAWLEHDRKRNIDDILEWKRIFSNTNK